jgi:hypothetical protein
MNIHLNMKSSLQSLSTFLLVLATSGATLVPATAVAGSAVVRGDFNNDGKEDIFAVRDGEYSVRANAAEAGEPMQALSFLTPPLYLNPDTVKVADIDQDGFDDVLLASRQANRLLVIYGQAVLGGVWRTSEFLLTGGPVGADAAQFISGGALEILSPLNALPQPNSTMLNAAGASIQAYALPSLAGSWTSVDVAAARLLSFNPLPQFAWLSRGTNGVEQLWWTEFMAASPGAPPIATTNHTRSLDAFVVQFDRPQFSPPKLGHGHLILASDNGQWVVLPSKTNVLAIIPANFAPSNSPIAYRESLGFVGNGGAVIPDAAGDLIVVTAADGTFARLFRWQGPGNLTVVETIPAPANQSLLHALPLSDGNLFMALSSSGTSGSWTAFAHYNRTGAVKGYTYVESLPAKSGNGAVARVMVFDRDPFGGDALEWESFSLGGWALDAQVQGGKVLVDFQIDPGLPNGLGEQTSTSLTPRRTLPSAAVALANQWEPGSSVFFGVAPSLAGGAGVAPQPPPGSYSSPVNVSFMAAQNVSVFYRLNNGNWQAGRGPVLVSGSMTVEFYGVTPDGYAGPIGNARYTIGRPADSLPGSLRQDSDHNGLDDAWERLFFGDVGINPNGDADNDQFPNDDEYRAGTNPRDALSHPPGLPGSERKIIARVSPDGQFRFRLETDTGANVIPEYSTDLQNWLPLPGTPQTLPDGSREWTDPNPPTGMRFYRFSSP